MECFFFSRESRLGEILSTVGNHCLAFPVETFFDLKKITLSAPYLRSKEMKEEFKNYTRPPEVKV